jgi:hypothetical protein
MESGNVSIEPKDVDLAGKATTIGLFPTLYRSETLGSKEAIGYGCIGKQNDG